ncbi:MAG: hypothetical protein RJB04_1695 [Verrucomicrobiota bacterium]
MIHTGTSQNLLGLRRTSHNTQAVAKGCPAVAHPEIRPSIPCNSQKSF